jgi:YHS domain-containing protein
MTVKVSEARADGRFLEYNGSTYVFCSAGCVTEFRSSPETYADESGAPDKPHAQPHA